MLELRSRRKRRLGPVIAFLGVAGLHIALVVVVVVMNRTPAEPKPEPIVIMPTLFELSAPAPVKRGGGAQKVEVAVKPTATPELVQPENIVAETIPTTTSTEVALDTGLDPDAPVGEGDPDGVDWGDPDGEKNGIGSCIGDGCGDGPVDLSQYQIKPVPLFTPPPKYPSIARRSVIEGRVRVEIVVNTKGRVESARIIDSQPPFDDAALAAVEKWRFKPLEINGQKVAWKYRLTVRFELQ